MAINFRLFSNTLLATILLTSTASLQAQTDKTTAGKPPLTKHTLTTPTEAKLGTKAQGNVLTATFQLNDMLGNDKIIINGSQPSYTFYPPIPTQWQLIGTKLHLVLNYSSILGKNSVLTLLINDQPISSVQLTPEKSSELIWDMDLPIQLMTSNKLPIIKISGFVRTNDSSFCPIYDTASTWVRVKHDSTMTYSYKPLNFQPDLVSFPYPFIRDQSPKADKTTIVFPASPSNEELISALRLTSFLASKSTWRGITINATTLDNLSVEQKNDSELIFIGPSNWFATHISLLANLPVPIGADGLFHTNNDQKIGQDTGVIMLAPSPWNPVHGAMFISGNTRNAINNAITNLQQPEFSQIAYGNYVLTANTLPKLAVHKLNWNKVTFNELGYPSQVVNGSGEHVLHYDIRLPNDQMPEWVTVNFDLSHSSLVSEEPSSLTLAVNKIPQVTLKLARSNENHGVWQVVIPRKQLVVGQNALDLIFDMHVPNEKLCNASNQGAAWAVIHSSSSINVHFANAPPQVALREFPVPFNGQTLVVLADNLAATEQDAVFHLISELGAALKEEAPRLQIVTVKQATPQLLAASNVIIVGAVANNELIKKMLTITPVSFTEQAGLIQEHHLQLLVNKNYPLGILELTSSPWNKHKTLLTIASNQESMLSQTVNALADPTTRAKLVGNVAVIQPNNTVDSFNTWPSTRLVAEHFMGYGLIAIVIFILLALALACLIVFRFYKKQNSSK